MTLPVPPPPPRSTPVLDGDNKFTQPWSGWFRRLWNSTTGIAGIFTSTQAGLVPPPGALPATYVLAANGTWILNGSGGGGTGTVTSVTAGDGLVTNPGGGITVTGSVSLQYRFADTLLMMGA